MTTAQGTPGEPTEFDTLLALALGEHRAGRLAEAEAAYRKILALWPEIAEVYNNLGVVLKNQGRLDQAVASYRQAITLKPELANAHNNLGNVLREQGHLDQAVARYQQAVALRPDYAEAHNNLGIALWRQGKSDQAVARYQQALALNPGLADAHNNLANTLNEQGQRDQALAHYQQAIALRPDHPEAHNNLGGLLLADGKLDDAVAHYEQALAFRPDYAEAHYNLANTLKQQGKLDQALPHYHQAIDHRPGYAEAHYNLGNALKQQGRLEQALAHYEQALALRPDYAEALKNLAVTLRDQLKYAAARQAFERLAALRPDAPDAHVGLATCHLVEGDYERGWPAYEARLRMPDVVPRFNLPRWSGERLAGRSLLLYAEQGLGDTFQFIRFARVLKERGARIILAAPAAVGRLLAVHPDVDELFLLGSAEELPRADFYLPLLSAPLALGTTVSTIPGEVPYLAADVGLTSRWRDELAAIGGFKIGIVWQGSPDFPADRWRSIPLAQFAPLARLPGVRLISLQKGFGSEQIAAVDFPLLDLAGRLDEAAGPFMDTAAVIRNLDLVVAPDTAIAHLAGALGAPVWIALQFSGDWRWLEGRDDSPWYPNVRLFRQTTFGEWPDVFERIADAVQARRMRACAKPATAD